MPFILEVIATSVEDAVAAQTGGAGRIELCTGLEEGGLTPHLSMVRQVLREVGIPVRVMVCENPSYETPGPKERIRLLETLGELSTLDLSGVVLGFARGDRIDALTLYDLVAVAPNLRVTFHRVFERLRDPFDAVRSLQGIPQVDRILLSHAPWAALAAAAAPEITLVAGGGLRLHHFRELLRTTPIREFHAGRAVREQQKADGRVEAQLVRQLINDIGRD